MGLTPSFLGLDCLFQKNKTSTSHKLVPDFHNQYGSPWILPLEESFSHHTLSEYRGGGEFNFSAESFECLKDSNFSAHSLLNRNLPINPKIAIADNGLVVAIPTFEVKKKLKSFPNTHKCLLSLEVVLFNLAMGHWSIHKTVKIMIPKKYKFIEAAVFSSLYLLGKAAAHKLKTWFPHAGMLDQPAPSAV